MKRSLTVAIFLILSALSAHGQCDTEAITTLYNKFVVDHKAALDRQKAASEIGKQYLARFGECQGEHEKKITTYIKTWLADYEAKLIESTCQTAVSKTPAQAFEACRPYIAKDPDNLKANLWLSGAGVVIAGRADPQLKDEIVRATRKSLDLINAGKTVDNWVLGSKDDTVATLEFYSTTLNPRTTPAETVATMLNLARSNTRYSKDPAVYRYLGDALRVSEVKKSVDAYKQTCEGKEATPDCEAAYAKIESAIDRVIDAYARAVALSAGKPDFASIGSAAKASLAEVYKQRHDDSEDGLDRVLAEILAKPIP